MRRPLHARKPHDFQEYVVPAGTVYHPGRGVAPVKLPIDMKTFRCTKCGRTTGNTRTDDTSCHGIKGPMVKKGAHL